VNQRKPLLDLRLIFFAVTVGEPVVKENLSVGPELLDLLEAVSGKETAREAANGPVGLLSQATASLRRLLPGFCRINYFSCRF
jgi:hypothetical protein